MPHTVMLVIESLDFNCALGFMVMAGEGWLQMVSFYVSNGYKLEYELYVFSLRT